MITFINIYEAKIQARDNVVRKHVFILNFLCIFETMSER